MEQPSGRREGAAPHFTSARELRRPIGSLTDLSGNQARGLEWVKRSGIQDGTGACHAWFDEDAGGFSFVYPEITAYYATTCCFFGGRTGNQHWIGRARSAADWLSKIVIDSKAMVPAKLAATATSRMVYSFDLDMILHALCSLMRWTNSDQYFAPAKIVADWLTHHAFRDAGAFWPAWDPDAGRFVESPSQWSLYPGSHQAKIGLALVLFGGLTGGDDYSLAGAAVGTRVAAEQASDGKLSTFANGDVNLHPHSYGAEGLWGIGTLLGQQQLIDASALALRWMTNLASPDGALPRGVYGGHPAGAERVDVLAQSLRLHELHRRDRTTEDEYVRSQLAERLVRFQSSSRDPRSNGGFYFGRLSSGVPVRHINAWASFFACQALYLHSQMEAYLQPGDLI